MSIVTSGIDCFRQTIPVVLRHFDPEVIASVSMEVERAIHQRGMRFAASQAFGGWESPPPVQFSVQQAGAGEERAAGYLLEYPGRLASLVGPWIAGSPPYLEGMDAAVEVLRSLLNEARQWEVELVQSVIDWETPFSREALRRSGMRRLSTLFQMALVLPERARQNQTLSPKPPFDFDDRLIWKAYAPEEAPSWIEWMDETYEATLDCPELNGLRSTLNTLEGYRESALPSALKGEPLEWWGAFERRDRGDGVAKMISGFLLSRLENDACELSYMGVIPKYRRRGMGEWTLQRAIERSMQLGAKRLSLAVDSRNAPAIRMYRRYGFLHSCQLEAWFFALPR